MVCFMAESCNNKRPFKVPYYGAAGTVIGKETCNADIGKDYWFIEIASSLSVRQQYGDTITLNGIKYFNVIKTAGLPEILKQNGQKVGFDFKIAGTSALTTNCTVNNPIIYKLKVVELMSSSPASF